jgi:DnaJ-class molecular chaperone
VKIAYKKAVLLFHPDKHVEEFKEMAEEKFQLIQKSFEGLFED